MSSYRRYVAQHGAAVHRALKQVRSHALETPPDPVTVAWTRDTFRGFADRLRAGSFEVSFGPMNPDLVDERLAEMIGRGMVADRPLIVLTDPDPVLAYRGQRSGALRCLGCAGEWTRKFSVPLTSDDLPDGGICRVCGVDVLIPEIPVTTAECPECSHSHSSGTTCARAYGNVVCGCTV